MYFHNMNKEQFYANKTDAFYSLLIETRGLISGRQQIINC